MSRTPWSETLDAELMLMPLRGATTQVAALFKMSWRLGDGQPPQRVATPPLRHDWRDPALDRGLLGASDFVLFKPRTDIVVEGDICAPGATPTPQLIAELQVGSLRSALAVFGSRAITISDGRARMAPPEPFTRVPVTWSESYGGIDWRVPIPGADTANDQEKIALAIRCTLDHPGLYPRNHLGRGYVVESGPVPGLYAPSIEDPRDLVSAERLIVRDPTQWWRQPLPANWAFIPVNHFPRSMFLAPDSHPWFPCPDDAVLPEVARGLLPAGFLTARCRGGDVDARFYHAAQLGVERAPSAAPVQLNHLHPEFPRLRCTLPTFAAQAEFVIEGRSYKRPARLHHLIFRPNELACDAVFAADCALPRPFIPGIHKHIPISVALAGEATVPFIAPPTVRERRAQAAGATP